MTAPGPLGAVASAEAELAILRATAVRRLMARGAMRAEAVHAVDEQLGAELRSAHAHAEFVLARLADAYEPAIRYLVDVMAPAFAAAARSVGAAYLAMLEPAPAEPGHPVPDDHRWAAVLELKRAGGGSGPAAPRMDGRRAA